MILFSVGGTFLRMYEGSCLIGTQCYAMCMEARLFLFLMG